MNNKSNETIKQLNRLANDRNLSLYTRNKLRDAISHVRELQLKLSELMLEAGLEMNERVEGLETLTSKQRDLIKKLEYENRHLRLQTRALSKRIQGLKETKGGIEKELAWISINFDQVSLVKWGSATVPGFFLSNVVSRGTYPRCRG